MSTRNLPEDDGTPRLWSHGMRGLAGGTALAVALTAVSVGVGVGGVAATRAAADTTALSTTYKTATDEQTQSASASAAAPGGAVTGTAVPGDTIKWVVHYQNDSPGDATVDIKDSLAKAGAYVPGSLQLPPNPNPSQPFSAQFSTDGGGSWQAGTPPAGATDIGLTGTFPPRTQQQSVRPTAPLAVDLTNSAGDGYNAVSSPDDTTVYAVFHHNNSNQSVFCSTTSGALCPGWPAGSNVTATYVSPVAGTTIGTGANGMTTGWENGTFLANGRLYWAAQQNVAVGGTFPVGLMCLDLTSLLSCGFTQLGSSLSTANWPMDGSGIPAADGNYYYVSDISTMMCFNPATGACPGVTLPNVGSAAPTRYSTAVTFGRYVFAQLIASNNANYNLYCYDTQTHALCPGSPVLGAPINGQYGSPNSQLAPVLDTAGRITGVCAENMGGSDGCWHLDGTALSPSPYPAAAGWTPGFNGDPWIFGTRVYLPVNSDNAIGCYDFGLPLVAGKLQACSGFTPPANPVNYTVRAMTGNPSCLLADGDGKKINSFDASTGGMCSTSTTSVSASPSLSYCGSGSAGFRSWDRFSITGAPAGSYGTATVSITGSDGSTVPGFANITLTPGQALDLSAIPTTTPTDRLTAQVTFGSVTAAIVGGQAALSWVGSTPELCYETAAPPVACGHSSTLSNDAVAVTDATASGGGTDAPGGNRSGAAVFDVAPSPAQCSLDLKKTSSVAHTASGDTVTYTVTATNTGTMPYDATDTPATWTDDLTNVLTNASYNADASASAGTATYAAPVLSWHGPLAAGATASVTYSVHVASTNDGHDLTNTVRSDVVGSTCPSAAPAATCTADVPVYGLTIRKEAAEPFVQAVGQVIHYTFLVTNTGSATVDRLSVVDTPAAPAGPLDAPPSCPAASLAPGASTTCIGTYTVTAADLAHGVVADSAVAEGVSPSGDAIASPPSVAAVPVRSFTVAKAASATQAHPGDTITYTITVTNTGQFAYTAADPASFADDLTGVVDDATYDGDATGGAVWTGSSLSWSGALAPGETKTITYSVTVDAPDTGDHLLRNAVSPTSDGGSCDPNAVCTTTTPVASFRVVKTSTATSVQPGTVVPYTITVTNTGQVAYTLASPARFADDLSGVLDDASYGSDAAASTGSLAYSDPVLSWSGALGVGETATITYSVTVNTPDTGDKHLDNTVTTPGTDANCPAGAQAPECAVALPARAFTVEKTATPGSTVPGGTVSYTVTVRNTGQVAYTAGDPASFTDDLTGVLDDATYNGDATNGAMITGTTLTWSGPLPIGAATTIAYSVTVHTPDTADHLLSNSVTPTASGGTCSTRPGATCATLTPVASYAVAKSASRATVRVGETVSYTIAVTNTGAADYTAASPASFSDSLAGVLDEAVYNGDAASSSGAGVSYTAPTLTWSGPLAVGATVTVTYSVTVERTGDFRLDNTATPTGSGGGGPSTVTVPVQSYTVAKSAAPSTATPGAVVAYTITVTNTGAVAYTAADPASFTDDLTAVLDDATYNGDAAAGATLTGTTLAWSGPLPVGGVAVITYSVTVNAPDRGDHMLSNAVVPDVTAGGSCAALGACTSSVPVREVHLVKSTTATTVVPGQTVPYTITITNTGQVPFTAADPASFTDDLTPVLDDATFGNDQAASAGSVAYTAPTLSWSGPLAVGASVTVTYSVTVGAASTGDGHLDNTVVTPGPEAGNCAAVSTDPDCSVHLTTGSYTVSKAASTASTTPGGVVTYTITVANTGQTAYTADTPATLTDDLSQVLDDADYNGDATGGATVTGTTLSWAGALPVGSTVTLTYSVTVRSPDQGDHLLTNTVAADPRDGGGCDESVRCYTRVPVGEYTVEKTASPAQTFPGDTVVYTVTVKNTGQADYTAARPASFTDDLAGVLDDARYNGDATGGATVTGSSLSWSGPLAVGARASVTYSVTIENPDTGDHILANVVTATGTAGTCAAAGACTTRTPVASFEVHKSASTSTTRIGETVTYTIEVTNTGAADYTAAAPASFTDDLTGVLDEADIDGQATATSGTVAYTQPLLSWHGALAVGETATVTYRVLVQREGDHSLDNAATPTAPGGGGPSTATVFEQSFTVSKSTQASGARPGDVVQYTIDVVNTGLVAYGADDPAAFSDHITDDLSDVLDDATYNNDATGGATLDGNILSWSGPLPVHGRAVITYSVTVDNPSTGNHRLVNSVAASSSAGGECAALGACATLVEVQALHVTKSSPVTTLVPGGIIPYTIVVTNVGASDYTAAEPAAFTDDLAKVLDDATLQPDPTASSGALTYGAPVLSWFGELAAGASATITYSVRVNDPLTGDGHLDNTVVTPDDVGGNCGTGSTDPDCTVQISNASYTVAKTADVATATSGSTVHYTLTITNTGPSAYTAGTPATMTDDLTNVLDDADYGGDATASGGTVGYDSGVLRWSGPLPVGATVTVAYSVLVRAPYTGDHLLRNTATATTAGGSCAPSGCTSLIPVASYTVRKTASTATAHPGDTIAYTVTVSNTGGVHYTAANPAVVDDDLTQMLRGATYNDDARSTSGTPAFTAPVLRWSGPLPVGATVTITFSATVLPGATGTIPNRITTPRGSGANCAAPLLLRAPAAAPENDPCLATTTVVTTAPPPGTPPTTSAIAAGASTSGTPLADTGSDVLVALLTGLTLGMAGALLVLLRRRRTQR